MRPVFNAGHYTHASGFEYAQNIFETESRERLLAVIDSYGIVSGYGFSDVSSAGNVSLQASRGLAYDGLGRRIKLTQAQAVAGLSTVTGITSSDLNKLFVVENAISGVQYEAHPTTGNLQPTRNIDYPFFSLIAAGSLDVTKHVRIGRIYQVVEGTSPSIGVTITSGRDTLSFPQSSPFVVVGPAGDSVADFTGNDSAPFNNAQNQLVALGGGTIIIRPGQYTIDPAAPIVTEGFESIKFIGFGRGSQIRCEGAMTHWKVSGCQDVLFENLEFYNSKSVAVSVQGTEKFTFRDNAVKLVPSPGVTPLGVHLVSGIQWAVFEENLLSGLTSQQTTKASNKVITFLASEAGGGNIFQLDVDDNKFHFCDVSVNGEVKNFRFQSNEVYGLVDLVKSTARPILRLGRSFSYLGTNLSQPKRAIVADNQFLDTSAIECAASGTVLVDNHLSCKYNPGAGESMVTLFDQGTNAAHGCTVSNNVFVARGASAFPLMVGLTVWTKRNAICSNTFDGPDPTGVLSNAAIELAGTSSNNIVDDTTMTNWPAGYFGVAKISNNGTSNWAKLTDNTSNKVV